jgi:hypothetical protein
LTASTPVSSATPTTPAPILTTTCDDSGSCHRIVTNYTEDESTYLELLQSCASALSVNLQNIYTAITTGDHSGAFIRMATILVGPRASSHSSREVLIHLLEGKMHVALPYFAIKQLFAASNSMLDTTDIKSKHVLKILDLCLAWHHKQNKFDLDAIKLIRKGIAVRWGRTISEQDIFELKELSHRASSSELYELCEKIPPTHLYEVVQFVSCKQEDQDWARFVLRILSADEVDIGDLRTNLASRTDTRTLLGNVQAAGLLLKSRRRIENPDWLETYVTACLSQLHTISIYDHEPLLEALEALKDFGKGTTRKTYIGHMIMVVNGIHTIRTESKIIKKNLSKLVSGNIQVSKIATEKFPENQHQKDLPRLFATEVLSTVKSSDVFNALQAKEQRQIMKAFDAHFPNMDEATMMAVGDDWLDIAGMGMSSFGGTYAEIARAAAKKGAAKGGSAPVNPDTDEPSKPSAPHDEATQRVLAACGSANGLDKPPRGAYLRVAPSCNDTDATQLRSCIESDLAFKKTIFDERQNDRAIAGYLIERIGTIRAASKAHFGRRRVARVPRPPYAMSPWTAV